MSESTTPISPEKSALNLQAHICAKILSDPCTVSEIERAIWVGIFLNPFKGTPKDLHYVIAMTLAIHSQAKAQAAAAAVDKI